MSLVRSDSAAHQNGVQSPTTVSCQLTSCRWRPLEAALAALGAHAMSVLDAIEDEEACNRPKPFDIESLLTNVIPSLLTLTGE
jgi:hypothetical protein